MKIAVTGKGGVGKTTLSSVLARLYAEDGKKVLAADVDPDANLGSALGFSEEELEALKPLSEMSALIAERTGADANNFGKLFKMNPKVDDIPDKFSIEKNGVKLLIMGTVDTGGSGCVCPEHVLLKRVVSNLVVNRDEVVILDMEAGLEHLGRGTTDFVDRFIVVIEPGARSIQTYKKVKQLAADIGVTKISVVANKIRSEADREFLIKRIPESELLGFIDYNEDIISADRKACSPYEMGGTAINDIRKIKNQIDSESERNG
ncbi:MAG: AAA family ATPase [Oscillospiraceae bacterium]|jgi:CO dehydrogenase maturation factor|nr:AAA family ATPase [Oscillospiraceae bacterium]